MDVEDGDKRFPGGHDHESDGEHEIPGRSYTVTSLPASEHAELAKAVLGSSGPKINVASNIEDGEHQAPVSHSWPADHTAIC